MPSLGLTLLCTDMSPELKQFLWKVSFGGRYTGALIIRTGLVACCAFWFFFRAVKELEFRTVLIFYETKQPHDNRILYSYRPLPPTFPPVSIYLSNIYIYIYIYIYMCVCMFIEKDR